ncbi:MAG: GtrA family protein [Rikenellaceae bacterium]|nr:GtrA family protein [Rikenellaceae bacterium]
MTSRIKNPVAERSPAVAVQTVRYLIAGGLAFVVDFLVLKVLTDFTGLHYLISAALGFCTGLTITCLLSIYWVFDRRKMDDRRMEFIIFAAIGVVGLGLTSVFIWVFAGLMGINLLIAKILTAALVTAWNFAAKKIVLF